MIEYLSQNVWLIWVLASIICLLLELTSGDLFILCFSIGALCSAVAAALGVGWVLQILIFAFFTLLSIFFVRPVALRWLHRNEDNRLSNADALMGRVGTVSETIEEGGYGRVAIDGDDWKAVALDGQSIGQGERVTVVGRESIILTVEKS
ncbi:NfeD family protein [Prevotella sp. Rep29]|uniref:NfeD family protein n=1 Tax=Prevotella sp. Rep29 TaxID=2691580 RepID=UPI001B6A8713|nr:NfeD family protein [Prevotella sp. Rep29]MBP3834756.1 NfeD family protein [Prevotella sp.]QYR11725.1 NfeD family protein [Prevotella sp. Rep29]